jgi:hypothetical protein
MLRQSIKRKSDTQKYNSKKRTLAKVQSPYGGISNRRDGFLKMRVKLEPTTHLLTSTVSASGLYSWQFTLNDLPDVSNYSAIWDSYRFDKITACIQPATQISFPSTTISHAPLVTCIDYDDAAIPTTYGQILAHGTSMIHDPNAGVVRRSFIPHCAVGVADTSLSYANKSMAKHKWIDMSTTGVTHYGFKAVVKQAVSTNVFQYYIYFIFDISFKSTR